MVIVAIITDYGVIRLEKEANDIWESSIIIKS